jgi:hypothetical protein
VSNRSLTLGEECWLRAFENRVLRKTFELKKENIIEWKILHNKKFYDLYSSPNIILVTKSRRMRWAGHMAHMGGRR